MTRLLRALRLDVLWDEERIANVPSRTWRDWLLLALILGSVALEAAFRTDITWPWLTLPLTVATGITVLWRRTHPLATLLATFTPVIISNIATGIAGAPPVEIYTTVFVLIIIYSTCRWGSGRDAFAALGLSILALVTSVIIDPGPIGDFIGGTIVMLFPFELGVAVRFQKAARQEQLAQVRLSERAEFARELHDTVAHHVSAIVIQAQAGRFLLHGDTVDEADRAFETIEEEASRTLAEMRSMVRVLRDADAPAEMAPQRRIADIKELTAPSSADAPEVGFEVGGELGDIRPSVEAAVYRLAQESITNALRHARAATLIRVQVDGKPDGIHLSVTDDGDMVSGRPEHGYGIVGMSERASMLGGSLEVGPLPNGGWSVHAVLPREGQPA